MNCSICGLPIEAHPISGWDQGNNAQPVNDGRCCDECNETVVLRVRMTLAQQGKDPYAGHGVLVFKDANEKKQAKLE